MPARPVAAGEQDGGLLAMELDRSTRFLSCRLQEVDKQPAHLLGLLLLKPVSGAVDKVRAAHLCAGGALHALECPRILEHAPVALATDEQRWHVDRAARVHLQICRKPGPHSPITLQAALKSCSC